MFAEDSLRKGATKETEIVRSARAREWTFESGGMESGDSGSEDWMRMSDESAFAAEEFSGRGPVMKRFCDCATTNDGVSRFCARNLIMLRNESLPDE